MQILTWVWVSAAVILLFGAAIFVHELGHFLAARWLGLKVEGFSIGFGPKIIGWTRDGIEYAWRWIPAGGYVKLPQMVTSEALEGKSQSGEPLPPVSPWAKVGVAVAGPLMNGVFAFLLASVLYVVGLPVRVNPAIIGWVKPGSPEAKLGIRPGDRIVEVDSRLVKSWEDAQMTTVMARTNVLPVVLEREGTRTTYYLKARVNEQLGWKLLDLDPAEHPAIDEVKPGSAAEEGGVRKGDEVLSFAGVSIAGQEQLIDLIRQRADKATELVVKRGAEQLTLTVTPRLDPTRKVGILGMTVSPTGKSVYQLQKPGPLPWVLVGQVCTDTFRTLSALFNSKQTGIGVKDLSGPPGILAMLAAELNVDFRLGLRFMVLLNVSLAILNLLPLPVLDGGHILLSLFEVIRGRPLPAKIQEYATALFAVLLISFMLYVSYNDVVRRLPLFRSLFDQEVHIESSPPPTNAPAAAR
jgi:regulator of sigma E protease